MHYSIEVYSEVIRKIQVQSWRLNRTEDTQGSQSYERTVSHLSLLLSINDLKLIINNRLIRMKPDYLIFVSITPNRHIFVLLPVYI